MSPSKVSTVAWDQFYNVINGQNRTGKEKYQGTNPSTGEKLWGVPVATQQDVDEAVKVAKVAFESYRETTVEQRKEYLRKLKDQVSAHIEELTELLCHETGKPKATAQAETFGLAVWFDAHLALNIPEERDEDDEKTVITSYKPLGVIGAICPWNFPLLLAVGKICPALLTGNTIILKPSPWTCYTTLKLVELAQEVLPPGLVQVVGGNDKLGPMLTEHPDIAKISFTGSIATGKKIMAACAPTLKRVTLELGGNDAAIVYPDVKISEVAPALCDGAFQNTGQVCVATKRIYIHKDIYDEMLEAMVKYTKTITLGSPMDGSVLGPIQNPMQFEKVKGFYEDTKNKGYKFAVGEPDIASGKGFFVKPAIIDNPPNDSRIIQEEPFGPIVPTQPWDDEEEVIRRANDTTTGLGACVWSADVERATKTGHRLEAGSVFINSWEKPNPFAFFSGAKQSGIGGEWGKEGIKSYCNAHVMHIYK